MQSVRASDADPAGTRVAPWARSHPALGHVCFGLIRNPGRLHGTGSSGRGTETPSGPGRSGLSLLTSSLPSLGLCLSVCPCPSASSVKFVPGITVGTRVRLLSATSDLEAVRRRGEGGPWEGGTLILGSEEKGETHFWRTWYDELRLGMHFCLFPPGNHIVSDSRAPRLALQSCSRPPSPWRVK